MLNITRDTGEFLAARARQYRRAAVLDWHVQRLSPLAPTLQGNRRSSLPWSSLNTNRAASANFARRALAVIRLVQDDAGRFLQRSDESAYDLFSSIPSAQVSGLVAYLRRVLRPEVR
jgi:hypothetical protein